MVLDQDNFYLVSLRVNYMDIIGRGHVFIWVTRDLKEKSGEKWLPNCPLTQLNWTRLKTWSRKLCSRLDKLTQLCKSLLCVDFPSLQSNCQGNYHKPLKSLKGVRILSPTFSSSMMTWTYDNARIEKSNLL